MPVDGEKSPRAEKGKKDKEDGPIITEVLPKAGLVYSEKSTLTEVLCKPKIMPIKSLALERLEEMENEAKRQLQQQQQAQQVDRPGSSRAVGGQPAPGGRPGSAAPAGRPGSAAGARPGSAAGGRIGPR